jgi:hypothetical protein
LKRDITENLASLASSTKRDHNVLYHHVPWKDPYEFLQSPVEM